ncbi:hypothetical protein HYT23_01115 [Candidatus Pacearchaeota archaeon]|nr:hypothetical protein [Candidatus Pacearchaeota archaeon]
MTTQENEYDKCVDMLHYIFGLDVVEDHECSLPHNMCNWSNWSKKNKRTVEDCVKWGLIELDWPPLSEKGFELVYLAYTNFLGLKIDKEQLRKKCFEEYVPVPRLTLTDEGERILSARYKLSRQMEQDGS